MNYKRIPLSVLRFSIIAGFGIATKIDSVIDAIKYLMGYCENRKQVVGMIEGQVNCGHSSQSREMRNSARRLALGNIRNVTNAFRVLLVLK